MDSGRRLALAAGGDERRVLRGVALAVRAALLVLSIVAMFLGSFIAVGTVLHSLRGPHRHSPSCGAARGNCTDAR